MEQYLMSARSDQSNFSSTNMNSLGDGTFNFIDPYTASLTRYMDRSTDRFVSQQSCPHVQKYSYSSEGVNISSSQGSELNTASHSSSSKTVLKVGYLSYDWRAQHPMGRLTANLVTGHHIYNDKDVNSNHILRNISGITNNIAANNITTYRTTSSSNNNIVDHSMMPTTTRVVGIAFSFSQNDLSDIRHQVETNAYKFIDLSGIKDDQHAAAVVHSEHVDIVVDLTAHTYNGRIAIVASKPAPITINYLGFPGTTGCGREAAVAVDYSMVHASIVPPEYAAELFTEHMLYLPYTYQVNDMPLTVPRLTSCNNRLHCLRDSKLVQLRDISDVMNNIKTAAFDISTTDNDTVRSTVDRETFTNNYTDYNGNENSDNDIPVITASPSLLVLCSFNAQKKFEPISFAVWMNIMLRLPGSVLVLLDPPSDAKQQILFVAQSHGIPIHRIVFIPKRPWSPHHLSRIVGCDLALDNFVYGAHSTASDVLWMGVPLLSLDAWGSQRMPSRVASSITQSLSLPSYHHPPRRSNGSSYQQQQQQYNLEPANLLTVESAKAYEDTAWRLLKPSPLLLPSSISSLQRLRNLINTRVVRAAAFNSVLMQRTIEQAYQSVYEIHHLQQQQQQQHPSQQQMKAMHVFIPHYKHVETEEFVDDDDVDASGEKVIAEDSRRRRRSYDSNRTWMTRFIKELKHFCTCCSADFNYTELLGKVLENDTFNESSSSSSSSSTVENVSSATAVSIHLNELISNCSLLRQLLFDDSKNNNHAILTATLISLQQGGKCTKEYNFNDVIQLNSLISRIKDAYSYRELLMFQDNLTLTDVSSSLATAPSVTSAFTESSNDNITPLDIDILSHSQHYNCSFASTSSTATANNITASAANDITTAPIATAIDITTAPIATAIDITTAPIATANDITTTPITTANDITTTPITTANDITTAPTADQCISFIMHFIKQKHSKQCIFRSRSIDKEDADSEFMKRFTLDFHRRPTHMLQLILDIQRNKADSSMNLCVLQKLLIELVLLPLLENIVEVDDINGEVQNSFTPDSDKESSYFHCCTSTVPRNTSSLTALNSLIVKLDLLPKTPFTKQRQKDRLHINTTNEQQTYAPISWLQVSAVDLRALLLLVVIPDIITPSLDYLMVRLIYYLNILTCNHSTHDASDGTGIVQMLLTFLNIYFDDQCYLYNNVYATCSDDNNAANSTSSSASIPSSIQLLYRMIAAFAVNPNDNVQLLNIGTALMGLKQYQYIDKGFLVSCIAKLRLQHVKSLDFNDNPLQFFSQQPQMLTMQSLNTSICSIVSTASSSTSIDNGKNGIDSCGNDTKRTYRDNVVRSGDFIDVIFYCYEYNQGWWPEWGPSSFSGTSSSSTAKESRRAGGAEEAVYYTALELAALGYIVVIYAEVNDLDDGVIQYPSNYNNESIKSGKVIWKHYTKFPIAATSKPLSSIPSCNVFIAWRYSISMALSARCTQSYLWLHDLVPRSSLPVNYFRYYDGILVQSDFHKEHVLSIYNEYSKEVNNADVAHNVDLSEMQNRIIIVPNGITITTPDLLSLTGSSVSNNYMEGANHKNVFIYGSAPNRGLALVLHEWAVIKQQIPDAILEVYYGFTDAVIRSMRNDMGVTNFENWYTQVQSWLQQDGVVYYGTVDHATLTSAYARAGFLLYPSIYQETGCITVLRAMSCGAIPITSRLIPSVLHHHHRGSGNNSSNTNPDADYMGVTGPYDMGPTQPLNISAASQQSSLLKWLQHQWTPAVITAYRTNADQLQRHRAAMKMYVRSQYTWTNTAKKMQSTFSLT